MIEFLPVFITFFAVIDPIGTIPVFIAVTHRYDNKTRRRIAFLAAIISAGILFFFVLAGELILKALSIPLPAFQISGSIVLFLFALNMIFGPSKPEEEIKLIGSDHKETAIFPLAVPSIASPGAMLAAVLLTENSVFSLWQQAQTVLIMLSVVLLTYLLMLVSGWINRFVGSAGASVISRIMGLILSSVATANILSGVRDYFQL